MVAENSSVWRSVGVLSRMNSRSSRKPRSSISSASSSTMALSWLRSRRRRSIWSRRRPGVPTTMWAPRPSWRPSARASMPPTQVTMRAPVSAYSQTSSRCTCMASSRVGAMISASGAAARSKRSVLAEQRQRHGEAERDGLAGAGLGRDEQVAAHRVGHRERPAERRSGLHSHGPQALDRAPGWSTGRSWTGVFGTGPAENLRA